MIIAPPRSSIKPNQPKENKMKTNLKKILKIAGMTGIAAVAGTAALASNDTTILTESCGYIKQIQTWIFGVAYVLGAIGLVIIAVSAFLGRFKFSHLIALGGGLFIVAMADLIIGFITSGNGGTDSCTGA